MVRYLFVCLCIGVMLMLHACNETKTCTEVMISHLNLEFFNKKTQKDTIFDSIAFSPLNSKYTGYFQANYAHSIPLPLSPLQDTTTFLIKFFSTKWDTTRYYDTITKIPLKLDTVLRYKRYKDSLALINTEQLIAIYKTSKIFVSYDCGFRTDFTLDTLLSQPGFDSLKIIQSKISNLNDINCKIYLNPFTGK